MHDQVNAVSSRQRPYGMDEGFAAFLQVALTRFYLKNPVPIWGAATAISPSSAERPQPKAFCQLFL